MKIFMIDGPSPFASVETWERHLADLKSLPDDTLMKSGMIKQAEWMIADIREWEAITNKAAGQRPTSRRQPRQPASKR